MNRKYNNICKIMANFYYTDINEAETTKVKPVIEVGEYTEDVSETALCGKMIREIQNYQYKDKIIIKY